MKLFWHFRALLAIALAAAAFIYFSVAVPQFTGVGNVYPLMQSFAMTALLASGLACAIIAGEFDLSIAGIVPMAGLITAKVGESTGSIPLGIAAAIVGASLVGVVNSVLTARLALNSLAVTVGTLVFTLGIGFALAGGELVILSDYEFGVRMDNPMASVMSVRSILALALVVLIGIVMSRTWGGKAVYAIGSDSGRASSNGVNVSRVLLAVFLTSAVAAGVVGALQTVSLASANAGADTDALLQAVTAIVIGGVALRGGVGKIYGVVAGALLLAVISNGMSAQGATTAAVQLVNGLILLVVIVLDRPLDLMIRRRLSRALIATT